jgi:hypothetical protein
VEVAVVVVGIALVALLAIIVAPSRRVRAERRLPPELETRVLLGETPREIDATLEPHREAAPEAFPPRAS